MTTALTKQQRHGAALAYEDVELLVYDTAHKVRARLGGDFDELVAEANVIFSELCAPGGFDPDRGAKFSTWLRTKTFYGLLSYRQRELQRAENETLIDLDAIEAAVAVEDPPGRWSFLGGDAAEVVGMVLESPLELVDALSNEKEDAHDRLIDRLLGRDWSWSRITVAFEEIREVLR